MMKYNGMQTCCPVIDARGTKGSEERSGKPDTAWEKIIGLSLKDEDVYLRCILIITENESAFDMERDGILNDDNSPWWYDFDSYIICEKHS